MRREYGEGVHTRMPKLPHHEDATVTSVRMAVARFVLRRTLAFGAPGFACRISPFTMAWTFKMRYS